MSRCLASVYRRCPRHSFPSPTHFQRIQPRSLPPLRQRACLHKAAAVRQGPRAAHATPDLFDQDGSSSDVARRDTAQHDVIQEDARGPADTDPYDLVDAQRVDQYYNAILTKAGDSIPSWKDAIDIEGRVDENIIAVVDNFESMMSFESDEEDAVPLKDYWDAMSQMLGFAYRTGSFRAQHALDAYRYRAREFVGALSETTEDPTDTSVILSTLIGCLGNSPLDTLRVLSSHLEIPFYARADCCFHLRRIVSRWTEIQGNPELHQMYLSLLEAMRDPKQWVGLSALPPKHVALLLENLPRGRAEKLLHVWEETFPAMRDDESVWLTLTYIRIGYSDRAMGVLRRLSSGLLQNPNDSLMKAYVSLLKSDSIKGGSAKRSFRFLPSLLELGLPPIDIVQNMVVQNTAKSGLVGEAFDLYGSLEAQNVPVHGHTITTLLTQSMIKGDVDIMNRLMTMAQSREELACNPYVMSAMMGVVRHIAYGKRKLGPEQCLSYLLAIYDRAYNRKALVQIGILPPDQADAGQPELPNPHPVAFQNFVYSFILTQSHEARVRQIWDRVVSILHGSDEEMIRLLRWFKVTHIAQVFHAFLLFYQRNPFTLDAMLEVLQYMQKNHPELIEVPTWAIVLNGFLRHEQTQMVGFVQELMRMSVRSAPTIGHAERLEAWLVRGPRYVEIVAYVRELEAGVMPGADSKSAEESR